MIPPATIGMRTSRLAMTRATNRPDDAADDEVDVVASEIDATGQPCSLLNALR